MDRDLQKLLSSVTELQNDNDFGMDFQKYSHYAIRFPHSGRPGARMAWTKENFSRAMAFARTKLPPLVDALPKSIVNDKILEFIKHSYKNPRVKNISGLINMFSVDNLKLQNAIVKLYNIDTNDIIDTETFSVYPAQDFYDGHIKAIIENIKNNNHYDTTSHFYTALSQIFLPSSEKPFSVLVLKDIPVYKPKQDVTTDMVKERAGDFYSVVGLLFDWPYQTKNFGEYIENSLDAICYFDKEMRSFSLQDINGLYNPWHQEPVLIEKSLIDANMNLINLLAATDSLSQKIKQSIRWLGKSIMAKKLEDKTLQAAISLECLLSKNTKSPLQPSLTVSLAETLAFLIGTDKEDRIRKFNFLKQMYETRSAIVHSGTAELTSDGYFYLYKELKNGIFTILDLIRQNNWKSINDIYDYVENLKFA